MIKNLSKWTLLCKELELCKENGPASMGIFVDQIYNKFFKEQHREKHEIQIKEIPKNEDTTNLLAATTEDVWVFGYGSLVWKADFPYIDRRRGYVRGFQRRFYQNSIDHRGTPEKPGRVVTLLHTDGEDDRVYGVAYRIAAEQKQNVLEHLDYREKNGYERYMVQFHEFPESNRIQFPIIMYIATKENESYAGDVWEIHHIAEQIFTSAGPSGCNRDYLFKLATSMRELFPGVIDEHLFELEKAVMRRIECDEPALLERFLRRELARIVCNGDMDNEDSVADILKQIDLLKDFCNTSGWKETVLTKALKEMTISG